MICSIGEGSSYVGSNFLNLHAWESLQGCIPPCRILQEVKLCLSPVSWWCLPWCKSTLDMLMNGRWHSSLASCESQTHKQETHGRTPTSCILTWMFAPVQLIFLAWPPVKYMSSTYTAEVTNQSAHHLWQNTLSNRFWMSQIPQNCI